MSMMQYVLMCAGVFTIAVGIFHIPFIWAKAFAQWDAEMNALSPLSRKLINTVLVALCLAAVIIGLTTFLLAAGSSHFDRIQVWFFFFCFLFWLWRTVWQILYLPVRRRKEGSGLLLFRIALFVIFVINTAAYLAPVAATLIE